MHLSILSTKQAGLLLSFLLSLPVTLLAGDTPVCDGNESPTLDGPTSDRSAGIGVEFETSQVLFHSKGDCKKEDIDKAKGKLVDKRQGPEDTPTWKLTSDTTQSVTEFLTAEYILNGQVLKVGSGDAAKAADAVASDIPIWDPSAENTNDVTIEDSPCNPWKIVKPDKKDGAANLFWAYQITVPMPLEGIKDLCDKAVAGTANPLLPVISSKKPQISVTKDFFQASPNGITKDNVDPQVLGFFSLVMNYAKAARALETDTSVKTLSPIMPRTEFITIFAQIKDKIKLDPKSLYDLVKLLACYKNEEDNDYSIDTTYCKDNGASAPTPIDTKMDGQTFTIAPGGSPKQSLTVQDWIKSIQDGTQGKDVDKLTLLDRGIDSSIGGLKDGYELENVLDSNPARAVPLFEFRDLGSLTAKDMKSNTQKAEDEVVRQHKAAGPALRRFAKRRADGKYAHIKRTDCPPTTDTGTTSPAPAPAPAPAPMPDIDACDVSYKFALDVFEIRGKNFDVGKLGMNGEGLLKQVRGCGVVEKWKFMETPKDPTYSWYASGTLPIGTKACVGRAVVSAAGKDHGSCNGAG